MEKALRKASPFLLGRRWGPGKKTCLMWAILAKGKDCEATVKHLLNKPGVEVNARQGGGGGLTALHLASTHSSSAVMMALLKVDGIKVLTPDKEGHTALERATKAGHNKNVLNLLEEMGSLEKEESAEDEKMLVEANEEELGRRDIALQETTDKNQTLEQMELERQQIVDEYLEDSFYCSSEEGESDVEVAEKVVPVEDETFFNLCRHGDVEAVRAAMARGADVNSKEDGFPCLVVAVLFQNEEVVRLLLSSPSIQVNQQDHTGGTALHATSAGTSVSLARLLLSHPGVDFAARDKLGKTPLMKGVMQGTVEVVRAMVTHMGLQLELRDKFGLNLQDIAKKRERSEFGTANTGSDMLALIQSHVTQFDMLRPDVHTMVDGDQGEGGGENAMAPQSREEEKASLEKSHTERLRLALMAQEERRETLAREGRGRLDQVAKEAEEMEVELKREMEERLDRVRKEFQDKIDELNCDKIEKEQSLEKELKVKMQELMKSDGGEVERILEENESENAEMISRHLDEDEDVYIPDDVQEYQEDQTSNAPECPLCFEPMTPPLHIYQCASGHLVCGTCRPRIVECPSRCGRALLEDRAFGAEALVAGRMSWN